MRNRLRFLSLRAAKNELSQGEENLSRKERRAKHKKQKQERHDAKKRRRFEKKQYRRQQSQLLQAKLTRSYRRVTVLAVFLIVTTGSWLLWHLVLRYAPPPELIATFAMQSARDAAPLLEENNRDPQSFLPALKPLNERRITSAITDSNGIVIASSPENILRTGVALKSQTQLPPGAEELWIRARRGQTDSRQLGGTATDGSTFAVVPIEKNKRVLGLLWARSAVPVRPGDFGVALFVILLVSGLCVGMFAAVVGTAFGFFTSRRLTERLQNISSAADAWSRGDFYVVANDDSPDEIGQLARRLNQMAGELQQLVALRQNLATAEERNRLARELHDTVKQQVFATAMQVGAARALVERDTEAAKLRLTEAEKLAKGAQGELTQILEQLRPGSYEKIVERAPDFLAVLQQTVNDWSRQTGIHIAMQCEKIALSPNTEQTLLRIVQEALSNVTRHSGASRVLISLQESENEAELIIHDNGCGFSSENVSSGMGLRNMRERAESLPHGKFELENQNGTRLQVIFEI